MRRFFRSMEARDFLYRISRAIIVSSICILLTDDVIVVTTNNVFAISLVDFLYAQSGQGNVFTRPDWPVYWPLQDEFSYLNGRLESLTNPYMRGMGLICAGNLNDAKQTFINSLDADFRPALSALFLGDLYALQGDSSWAVYYWSRSGAVAVLFSRAQALLSAGDIENTALYLSIIWDLSDRRKSLRDRDLADLYRDLGHQYFERKQYLDAASAYEATLQLAPNKHPVRFRLAKIYRNELGQLDEAVAEYERVIELGDGWLQAKAYAELGYTYFLMGQTEQAISVLHRSIALDQGLASPHYYMGLIFQQDGDLLHACQEYKIGLRLNPETQWVERRYDRYCVSAP